MKSGSTFLLAARQCEIAELEELRRTGELVGAIGRFVHALQRERGLSNVFLSSHGTRLRAQRLAQVRECEQVEREVRTAFEGLDTGSSQVRNGARLFSQVAVVVHGLEGLPRLRERVGRQALPAPEATAAYARLVAGLLNVVFEAADSATDPAVSRALVALFNFMQGKEFAGQERALGAACFAAGRIDAQDQQRWAHLVDAQQSCFQVFAECAGTEVLAADDASRDAAALAGIERLRRLAARSCLLDTDLSTAWYEACTRRIDRMHGVEGQLNLHLRQLCDARIASARSELRDQRAMLAALDRAAVEPQPGGTQYGPHMERSVLAMLQEQSRRLQATRDELQAVRSSLDERKLVERAKGLLMAHRQMSEDEAYRALRQMAMNQGRRLAQVAEAVLSLADVLPGGAR